MFSVIVLQCYSFTGLEFYSVTVFQCFTVSLLQCFSVQCFSVRVECGLLQPFTCQSLLSNSHWLWLTTMGIIVIQNDHHVDDQDDDHHNDDHDLYIIGQTIAMVIFLRRWNGRWFLRRKHCSQLFEGFFQLNHCSQLFFKFEPLVSMVYQWFFTI